MAKLTASGTSSQRLRSSSALSIPRGRRGCLRTSARGGAPQHLGAKLRETLLFGGDRQFGGRDCLECLFETACFQQHDRRIPTGVEPIGGQPNSLEQVR